MKVCPVCNETFGDDLNFCDVDGVKLEREGATPEGAKNRLYSMLGIGLLVGALAISGISMVFLSRSTVSSITSATAVSTPSKTSPAETAVSADTAAAPAEAEPPAETVKPVQSAKREILPAANANLSAVTPDVKAAALQNTERPAPADAAKTVSQPEVETQPAITPVSETRAREVDSSSRSARSDADARKEAEKQSASARGEKDSKKKDEGKEKKKGGFFRAFKKIFGKD